MRNAFSAAAKPFPVSSKRNPLKPFSQTKNKAKIDQPLFLLPCVNNVRNNVRFLLCSVKLACPVGVAALELSVLVLKQLLLHWIRSQKSQSLDPTHPPSYFSFSLPPCSSRGQEFENLTQGNGIRNQFQLCNRIHIGQVSEKKQKKTTSVILSRCAKHNYPFVSSLLGNSCTPALYSAQVHRNS